MQHRSRRPTGSMAPLTGPEDGQITRLDYFAAHAPHEIPAWFEPSAPDYDGPAFPAIPQGIPEDDRKMLESWTKDACFDLDGEYAWFQEAAENYWVSRKKYDNMCKIGAYYEWRWEYAKCMVAFRSFAINEETS